MKVSGWGNYPKTESEIIEVHDANQLLSIEWGHSCNYIARGLGRSYGDSSLSSTLLDTHKHCFFKSFNKDTGELTCTGGMSFDEILMTFVPKGWFLPVTPGTKFVTVGGAIASDVHGKNHHIEGSFCDHVSQLKVFIPNHGEVLCSPEINQELFMATCGGMGLTGTITEATFKLKSIQSSFIQQKSYKAKSLDHALELFELNANSTYSVAWIDCLAKGKQLGRSLVMTGEHATDLEFEPHKKGKLAIPFNFPQFALNPLSIKVFNQLYYNKQWVAQKNSVIHYDPYFYPLDGIHKWNRMYGKNGFCQYQFVIPFESGKEALKAILNRISDAGLGSFLAVLKVFGKGNSNPLSFPIPGYTLALDFKYSEKALKLMDELDKLVLEYQGRLYLTKDSRMSEHMFKASYPDWSKLAEIREKFDLQENINSAQSIRLGI